MKFPFLLNSVHRCRNSKDVEQVFGKLLKALPTLEGNVVSNCLNLLSKKEINHTKSLWQKTAEILTSNGNDGTYSNTILSKYDVKDVCIILNSFAKVDYLFSQLIDNSTKIITQQIRNLHTRDLCNVIHSLGKLNQITPLSRIINKLFKDNPNELDDANKIYEIIEGCNEMDFSMLLRVFLINSECLKFDAITNKLLKSMSDKFDDLSDQTLAILANSVALYGKDNNGTLSILAPIITLRLRGYCFTPQCVAQISNGYARLNQADKKLFSALAERVLFNVSEFPPRSLANILNGFSKLGIFHKKLFVSCIPQFNRKVYLMTPQCIANTINSYTKFSSNFERELLVPFFNRLIDCILGFTNFDSFIGQNYANILNGVSKLYMQGFLSSDQQLDNNKEKDKDNKENNNQENQQKEEKEKEKNNKEDNNDNDVDKSKEYESKEEQKENYKNEQKQNYINEQGLKVFELFSKLSKPIMKITNKLNYLDVLMITNSMSRCRVVDLELLEKMLEKLKLFSNKYKCLEMVNILNSIAILYSCKDPENLETVYLNNNKENKLDNSNNKDNKLDNSNNKDNKLDNSNNNNNKDNKEENRGIVKENKDKDKNNKDIKGIYDSLLNYYMYFVDYFVGNLDMYKNVRPLDIRLVFKSLGKCSVFKEEYCDKLVDKYLELDKEFNLRDLAEIVKYYNTVDIEVPEKLKKYVVEYMDNNNNKENNNKNNQENQEDKEKEKNNKEKENKEDRKINVNNNRNITVNEVIDRMNELI